MVRDCVTGFDLFLFLDRQNRRRIPTALAVGAVFPSGFRQPSLRTECVDMSSELARVPGATLELECLFVLLGHH